MSNLAKQENDPLSDPVDEQELENWLKEAEQIEE